MYIGIDLGGTNIAVGVVDEKGKIYAQGSTPTLKERSYQEIVSDMAKLCVKLVADSGFAMDDIEKIGIGCPGTTDSDNGVVIYAPNIKMSNVPLADELRKYINKPIHLENDANAAAYGEYVINGGNSASFICVTLGTGVGSGIILDGKIYRGFNGAGAEFGHMTLVSGGELCACGKDGCWERYASVTALISQTKAAMKKYPQSKMNELASEKGKVSGRTAFEAAKMGDEYAKKVVEQYLKYVADGIVSIVNIFQPEKIVIGGGISREGDYLLNPIRKIVEKNDYNKYGKRTAIEIAKLFNEAGIIGAALAAK